MSLAPPVYIASSLSSSYTPPTVPRKRTTSFSSPNPRPTKAPRTSMGSLRRTESFLSLRDMQKKSSSASTSTANSAADRKQRERTKLKPVDYTAFVAAAQSTASSRSVPASSPSTPHFRCAAPVPYTPPKPAQYTTTYRSSSPLSPHRTTLPGRPIFPKSKTEPDLYKKAIITRMRCTPEGQRILNMGPKLAFSIMTATKELERIVASHEKDNDVAMSDNSPSLSSSWVVVPTASQDWEMVDCGA